LSCTGSSVASRAGRFEITTIEADVGSVAITAVPSEDRKRSDPTVGLSLTARPNRSLSPAVRNWVAAGMCVPVLVVALVVAAQGAWLVMPFAGLEMAMIVFAFRWLRAGDSDYETVSASGHELVLRRSVRGRTEEFRFNLHWVQVVFEPAGIARKSVLALRSHGRVHPIGHLMTEAERTAAADYLVTRIRHARAAAA
jgi:uncharacterized membrane protein